MDTAFQFPGATGAERAEERATFMAAAGNRRCGPIPRDVQPRQMRRRLTRKLAKAMLAQQRRATIAGRRTKKVSASKGVEA